VVVVVVVDVLVDVEVLVDVDVLVEVEVDVEVVVVEVDELISELLIVKCEVFVES